MVAAAARHAGRANFGPNLRRSNTGPVLVKVKTQGSGLGPGPGGAKCPIHSAAIAYSVLSLTQSPHAARLLPTARRYRPVIDGRSIARRDRCVQVSARACTSMRQRCSVTFNHTHTHTYMYHRLYDRPTPGHIAALSAATYTGKCFQGRQASGTKLYVLDFCDKQNKRFYTHFAKVTVVETIIGL